MKEFLLAIVFLTVIFAATAATLMLQQGIHPKIVQERIGQSDISLTLNTFSYVLTSMQEEAAEKLDELLNPIYR